MVDEIVKLSCVLFIGSATVAAMAIAVYMVALAIVAVRDVMGRRR